VRDPRSRPSLLSYRRLLSPAPAHAQRSFPVRIVSLLPSATDAVIALGAADHLVGISHSCDAAVPGAVVVTACEIDIDASSASIDAEVREIKSDGRALYKLDHEKIESLAPDLIITQGLCEVCAVSEAEVHRLAARLPSKPRVVSLSGGSIDGVFSDLRSVAEAIDRSEEADELLLALSYRMRRVHLTLKAAKAARPRVVVLEWTDPFFSGGHWVPEQVKRAGGVDVIGKAGEHSRVFSVEELTSANPEIVIVAPCGFGLDRAAAEGKALRDVTPALGGAQWWAVDANSLTSRPGPRIVDGIEAMARIFAPTLFTPLSATLARRL
jgi:iron complex transport system substrate-binding protein